METKDSSNPDLTQHLVGLQERSLSSKHEKFENDHNEKQFEEKDTVAMSDLMYGLNDIPPWYLCIAFGFQHYLLTLGSLVGVPLLLAKLMCIADDELGDVARSNLISTIFVTSGICTILQTLIGNRLPIMQGSSFAFIPPILAILALPHNQCPSPLPSNFTNSSTTFYLDTDGEVVDGEELWQRRMREVQGAVIMASLFEVLLGFTGAVGYLMRFIGPLTIMPTIALIGLDLFGTAARSAQGQWGIAIFTAVILILCSQYFSKVTIPVPVIDGRKCALRWIPVFKLFPVLIALCSSWFLCFILTTTDSIPDDPAHPFYRARTDIRVDVIKNSAWFRIPYPGQWGLPVVTIGGFIGMISAVVSSIIESIGDYIACAKLSGAPPMPKHALNRGIMMEGIGCIFCGVIGSGPGVTSFSQNVAAIGITRVASRRVMLAAGGLFFFLGLISKFGSIFVTIPDPVIGGIFLVMFGTIAAVGLTNLRFVDLNSSRNIFIIGFTLFMGLTVANWMKQNPGAIHTGVKELDQIFSILLSSAMLVGGVLGLFLDNTLPGTDEERGIKSWNNCQTSEPGVYSQEVKKSYDLPFPMPKFRFLKYFPVLPPHEGRREKETDV
ncbi:solute carrier family 23 member 1-like [Clavelina lepadiformis]|uniref:solute carrier family 23 member 1-like n=1 Tax=Clavelina lepadiformis TaxID=159417 RepID=UPI0040419215